MEAVDIKQDDTKLEFKKKMYEKLLLAKELKIRKARESFWEYCKVINPEFYKADRTYLKLVADSMQGIYEGTLINPNTNKPYKNMSLNLPP